MAKATTAAASTKFSHLLFPRSVVPFIVELQLVVNDFPGDVQTGLITIF
jgi:hypothetical protein